MIVIHKKPEPKSLLQYRKQSGSNYNGLSRSIKNVLRDQLLKEQGHLCCYCMCRIDRNTMKIEHWHCQSKYPAEQLDYKNLLAACKGNEGSIRRELCCDTRKGDDDLRFNPADTGKPVENHIHYGIDGRIESRDSIFDRQINDMLNLNSALIKGNRKAVIKSVRDALSKKSCLWKKRDIKNFIQKWDRSDSKGLFKEYKGAALYFLNLKLRKM